MKTLTRKDLCRLADQCTKDRYLGWDMMCLLPWGNTPYYNFLLLLAKELQPKMTVELGTGEGTSACFLARGASPHRVITVESDAELVADRIMLFKSSYDLDNLTPVIGDSCGPEVLEQIAEQPIDLLYVDSDHCYDQAKKEYDLYRPRMSPGAVIVWDDIHINDGMKRFWGELTEPKEELSYLHSAGFGAAIVPSV